MGLAPRERSFYDEGSFYDEDGLTESPQRTISIRRFAVSRTEITFEQWQVCFAARACGNDLPRRGYAPAPGSPLGYVPPEADPALWEGENRPVINVSWHDAQKYVAWLSSVTDQDYRLLTEAEWEYSARGHTRTDAPHTRFSWGNDDPVCEGTARNGAGFGACNHTSTWQVGSFAANAFGLHDMHGNVWEWVEDCFAPYDPNKLDGAAIRSDTGSLEPNATCSRRVLRGGSWGDSPMPESAVRVGIDPTLHYDTMGFRVARTLSH
jgi:formylglycine-generating enzyme required for sulfatase activity